MMTIRRLTARGWVAVLAGAALTTATGPAAQTAAPRAYVADRAANAVSVIDTSLNSVVSTIPVGVAPADVVVSADGSRAYVANTGSNSITAIRTDVDAVDGIVDLGDSPSSLALTRTGDRLFVLGASGLLQEIDTSQIGVPGANPIVASTSVDATDGTIAVTPDATRLFVAAESLYVLDATDLSQPPNVIGLSTSRSVVTVAAGVTISPNGQQAYVSFITYFFDAFGFELGGGIAVVDTATGEITQRINLFSQPGRVTFNADGTRAFASILSVWANTGYGAAALPGHWIASINTADGSVEWIDLSATGAAVHTPRGLAVTPDQSALYVAIPSDDAVAAIDLATNSVHEFVLVPGGGPASVALSQPAADPARTPSTPASPPEPPPPPPPPPQVAAAPDAVTALAGTTAAINVLANDSIDGAVPTPALVSLGTVSADAGLSLNADGSISIAADTAAGDRGLTYRICALADAAICSDGTATVSVTWPQVVAGADVAKIARSGGAAIASVLGNDRVGDLAAATRVTLKALSASDPGVSLDTTTGAVLVARDTPAAVQTLAYRICETVRPANCAQGEVSITVTPYTLTAANDSARASNKGASTNVVNVLSNDRLGGLPVTSAVVRVKTISNSNSLVRLNGDGSVDVLGKTGNGGSLTYEVCEIGSAANCARATLTIDFSGKG